MYTFVDCIIHEKDQSAFCHDGYYMEQHTPQGGWKQQQHDDTTNLVIQFINEEISVTMRKILEMEAKSHPQEEQHFYQLSLPYDFKIQYNQYQMSSKKSQAVPNLYVIMNENVFHSLYFHNIRN